MPQESIYNLIAKKMTIPEKPPMYRSKYPHNLPPTGSTFGATVTTQIGVANMEGDMHWKPCRDFKRTTATFGTSKDLSPKRRPDMFLKKQTKELPQPHKFEYQDKQKKAAIPKRDEVPTMGLTSDKNFVVANALENILSKPPKDKTVNLNDLNNETKENKSTLNIADRHAEFGKVPEYLKTVKKQIKDEYDYINTMKTQQASKSDKFGKSIEILDEKERLQLLNDMKDKWEKINAAYQQMTIHVMPETKSSLARKEYYESEMTQLEKDIEKLSKPYVFIKQ